MFSGNKEIVSKCNDVDNGEIELVSLFGNIDDFPCFFLCVEFFFLLIGKEKLTKSAIKTKKAPKRNGGPGTKGYN